MLHSPPGNVRVHYSTAALIQLCAVFQRHNKCVVMLHSVPGNVRLHWITAA